MANVLSLTVHTPPIMCSMCTRPSLIPDPTLKGGKGLVHIKHFLGAQDAACHVTVMTTYWHSNASTALMSSNSWL